MTEDISIHDNHVLSYTVETEERRITLRTTFPRPDQPDRTEYTDVVFWGVVAHYFERGDMVSILFDVSEVSPAEIVAWFSEVFERNKNYGWPAALSYDTEAELVARLQAQAVKGFLITSSYGMYGFVLAQEMKNEMKVGAPPTQ